MFCPFCQAQDTKVIDSRLSGDGSQIRRRRECELCHARFTTFETADLALPRIVKSDGERQPFNGVKLKGGMLRALEKRPLSSEEVDGVFGSILTEIRQLGEREIASRQLGEIVMRNLKRVDQVAYVRFASVYRDFQDIKEFAEEISSLSKEKPKTTKKKKMKDQDFMARAIELAKKGRLKVQPNPMVGCVIVKEKKIIGEGWHKSFGGAHAEINAIKNCKRKFGTKKANKLIEGADLYVNLEPCSIKKNTPPCTNSIIQHGIRKVICGTLDPNPAINGQGIKILKKARVQVKIGILQTECKSLNRVFFTTQQKSRPYIILKSAQSIDGKIALKNGDSNWISSSNSRKDTHHIRSAVKGILVGRGTAEKDNPSLTMRLTNKELGLKKNDLISQPTKIILGNLKKNNKI